MPNIGYNVILVSFIILNDSFMNHIFVFHNIQIFLNRFVCDPDMMVT